MDYYLEDNEFGALDPRMIDMDVSVLEWAAVVRPFLEYLLEEEPETKWVRDQREAFLRLAWAIGSWWPQLQVWLMCVCERYGPAPSWVVILLTIGLAEMDWVNG